MSFNFLFNIDPANKKYSNKIDIYEDAIKILKIKQNINKTEKYNRKNTDKLNVFEEKKQLMDLEKSYKSSLILLDIMQKKMEKAILKKYEIEKNNSEVNQNFWIKKKFLNNPNQTFLKTK